jgi:hypothetical protein
MVTELAEKGYGYVHLQVWTTKTEADFQRIVGKHLPDDSSVATQNSHCHEVTRMYMFRHSIQRSKLQELLLSAGALTYVKLSGHTSYFVSFTDRKKTIFIYF